MKNFNTMMKQAQAMQTKMAKMQEELALRELEASAGGGAVTVVMNGRQEVLRLKIKPEAVDPEDVEGLEDLILAALTEARHQVEKVMQEEMSRVTGGLGLPPGLL